jgi:hypothetical protein
MEEYFYIESLTNDRLREEVGDLTLVPISDRVCGRGSSIVMASFTHISPDKPTRFSDGYFGVYYAAKTLETAIRESIHHREKFLKKTNQPACELAMRVYQSSKILKPLIDLRNPEHPYYTEVYDPENYARSQAIGLEFKKADAWGIVYNSVRHSTGECIAILRPSAISLPVTAIKHLKYVWNGIKIHHVYEASENLITV